MTATTAEPTQMAHTPDPRPDPPAAAETDAAEAGGRRWAILGDHPLLTALATLAVALLVLAFAQIHNRIDRLEDTMNIRFAEQDAKIDALDAKIDEINLKLTALIAALIKTVEVDAAIEGRLLDSEPEADDPGAVPG